ncbi:MAG TPA: ethanolamine ammonia-lyase subunit EutC [Granulicella sp.]|jgi:ethanolamine ammonia-lyase small subunit|nr:ethanolamine ammonia-lyase subunit EutC [Granulicella sp.]
MSDQPKTESTLANLRAYTPARIALARAGSSITTRDTLDFALAHAQARDAVHAALSLPTLLAELHARHLPILTVQSAAPDRPTYIRRPDLGRTLSAASRALLASHAPTSPTAFPQLTIILADGLSALATDRHSIPLLDTLLPLLHLAPPLSTPNHSDSPAVPDRPEAPAHPAWHLTPIILAEQARVALGDEIGLALGSSLTLMLLGERPGLSAADSLGAYLTWAPAPGRTDAQRNCVSNIRTGGLDPAAAAQRIAFYIHEARRLSLTGTALKDPTPQALQLTHAKEKA